MPEDNKKPRPEEIRNLSPDEIRGLRSDDAQIGAYYASLGPEEIRKARATTRRSTERDAASIRQGFRDGTSEFVKELRKYDRNRRQDGQLYARDRRRLERLADQFTRSGTERSLETIRSSAEASVSREFRQQAKFLERLGVPVPPESRLSQIQSDAVERAISTPFPGTDLNTRDRLSRDAGRVRKRYQDVIQARPDELDRKIDHLRRGVHDPKPGPTRIDGGCACKSIQRVNRTEQSRALREANLDLYKAAGLDLAYWRLGEGHKWAGGQEACEILARRTGPGVRAYVQDKGIEIPDEDYEGLYLINEFPEIPHPNCMCYQEPYMVGPLSEAAIIKSMIESETLPDHSMPVSDVPTQTSAVLNSIANELGLHPPFSVHTASVLGIDGAANLLASQFEGNERVRVRKAIEKIQADAIPQIRRGLDEARKNRDLLLAHVMNDDVLSSRSKASQIANIREKFASELQKAATNIAVIQAMDRHLQGDRKPLVTSKLSSADEVAAFLADNGIQPRPDNYRLLQQGGRVVAEIPPDVVKLWKLDAQSQKMERIERIKRGEVPLTARGTQDILPISTPAHPNGIPFKLFSDQQAGAKLIEEQKSTLLHFGAGLGKTPLVISSVSDLKQKGEIDSSCISTPAALRTQMVQEVLQFNKDDKAVLYTSASDLDRTRRSVLEEIKTTVLKGVPTVRGPNGDLVPDRSKLSPEFSDWLENEIVKRQSRVEVKPFSRNVEEMRRSFAEDRRNGVLFTVMAHDDLARSATAARATFDYIAIDEVHQMTSQSVTGGSFKADQLQRLTGDKIKYKVALTGTASKNNIGELWDIAEWLRPGYLPNKKEFSDQYDSLTLNNDVFSESLIRTLRSQIAEFTFTKHSPVEARLNNAFAQRHPDGTERSESERDRYVRNLSMTEPQRERAREIEETFDRFKARQESMSSADKRSARRELTSMQKELSKILDEYPDLNRAIDRPNLATSPPEGVTRELAQTAARLRDRIEESKILFSPETWRDNQHHKNLHGGNWKDNAKAVEVVRLLNEDLRGRNPIIHLERIESLEMVREALESTGRSVAIYEGSMSDAQRIKSVTEFNGGVHDAMIVTRAGSTGLNLQRSSTATIHFDTPWTYAEYLQREARNWRRGQQHAVDSFVLTHADSTTDQRRLELMKEKSNVLTAIDELSRTDDSANPLSLLRASQAADMRSYSEVETAVGRRAAGEALGSILRELNLELAAVKDPLNANVPVPGLTSPEQRERYYE